MEGHDPAGGEFFHKRQVLRTDGSPVPAPGVEGA